MPVAPPPFTYHCPKCNYTKVVKIKSDCLMPSDLKALNDECPKCGEAMQRKNYNGILDEIASGLNKLF